MRPVSSWTRMRIPVAVFLAVVGARQVAWAQIWVGADFWEPAYTVCGGLWQGSWRARSGAGEEGPPSIFPHPLPTAAWINKPLICPALAVPEGVGS